MIWQTIKKHVSCLAIALASLGVLGCSQTEEVPLIEGTVTVDGKPAGGLYVVFHDAGDPNAEAVASSTRTEDSGHFIWSVPEPGEYVITAFWPKRIVTQEETIEGPDMLRGKYRSLNHPAATVTIQAGENKLPSIDLSR